MKRRRLVSYCHVLVSNRIVESDDGVLFLGREVASFHVRS